MRIVVEDEGAGFDPTTLDVGEDGTGLTNLQHRSQLIGGRMEIEAAPGEGARITLEVPRRAADVNDDFSAVAAGKPKRRAREPPFSGKGLSGREPVRAAWRAGGTSAAVSLVVRELTTERDGGISPVPRRELSRK